MGISAPVYLVCALRINIIFVIMFAAVTPTLMLLTGTFWVWAEDYAGNPRLAQLMGLKQSLDMSIE